MTTEQQTRWIIGNTVSVADAEAMPVGTVLHSPSRHGGYNLTKQDDGRWLTSDIDTRLASDQLTEDYNTLVSLPSRFTVGQVLTAVEDLAEVPAGTVISAIGGASSSQYRKVQGGYVNVTNERHILGLDLFTPGVFSIVTLPEASDSEGEWTVGQVLTANEQFNLLPVGTVVRNSEGERYEMLTDHRNRNLVNGRTMDNDQRSATVMTYTIESLPGGDPWVIGEPMQAGVPGLLPVGSIVFQTDYRDLRYRRVSNGWESIADGTHYDTYIIGDSPSYTLESVGPEQEFTSWGEWTVGMTLTASQMDRLPVGSVVDRQQMPFNYERRAGGWYSIDAREGHANGVRIGRPANGTLLRLPAPPSDSEGSQVGQSVRDLEHMQSLPIGTVLRYRSGAAYTVADRHRLHRETDGRYFDMEGRAYHRYQIERLPQFTVGQVITAYEEFGDVPLGGVIANVANEAALYERIETGYRQVSHGFTYTLDAFINGMGEYRIHSLPDHVEPEPERVLEVTETFEQYVQRFRVTVLGAAQGSSVSLGPIYEGLQTLNAPDPERSVGMYVHFYDEDFNTGLPRGTVALHTDEEGRSSIVGWTGYTWQLLSGIGNYHQGPMKVVTMPGGETLEWVTREPTEQDAQQIEDFKTAAKVFGRGAKSSQGWCGVYERTMQVMGIDA